MKQYNFNITKPNPVQEELEKLLREHSTILMYPAKKVFLEPGMRLDGIYYIANGRTCHYMVSLDGTEKVLYSLCSGWFYGEAPCNVEEPTGLYSKTEVKTTIYKIPYAVPGGIKHTGSERTPTDICIDRIVGTRKAEKLTKG